MGKHNLADLKDMQYSAIYVDAMNLCVRSFHGMPQFQHKGEPTGMYMGVCRLFMKYRRENPKAKIVFLWEGADSWREKAYHFYKAKRREKKTPNRNFSECLEYVQKDILPVMGVEQHSCYGLEADDLAAYYTRDTTNRILIVSMDHDWFALAKDSMVEVLYKSEIMTESKIRDKLGYAGKQIYNYKILKGDPSDEVKGIRQFHTELAKRLVNAC